MESPAYVWGLGRGGEGAEQQVEGGGDGAGGLDQQQVDGVALAHGIGIVAVARRHIALARRAVELAAVRVAARLEPEDPGDQVLASVQPNA